MQHQPRRPAGTPTGGQFAPSWHPEAVGLELVDDDFFEVVGPDDDDPVAEPLDKSMPTGREEEPPSGLPFGLDADAITSARALVLAARTEVEEARRIDPETWQAAEVAVTAAGRALASAVDAEVARRHPKGFPVDPDTPRHDYGPEIAAYRDATLEVLGAVRLLGLPDGERLKTVDSHRPAAAVLDEVSAHFPTEWLAASQEKDPPLRARVSPHRAHYSPSRSYFVDEGTQLREVRYTVHDERNVPKGVEATTTSLGYWTWTAMEPRRVRAQRRSAELTVPSPNTRPEEARKTATHELTHRCEHANSQLGLLEDAFLRRRCSDEDGQLRPTRPIAHMRGERARDGGFVSPYVGKVYPTQTFHEVLSTGTEAVFAGAYGGLVGRGGEAMDADHRAFVLGCLAVA